MSDSPYAIYGLGNPGSKYDQTRHNIGFMLIDACVRNGNFAPTKIDKSVELYRGRWGISDVYLGKPQTYMNLSGQAIRPLLQLRKIPLSRLLVVTDDFALPLGRIRFRPSGSAGGHNGLKSIISELGSQDFARLRIGIGPVPERWDCADFVLGRFASGELEQLQSTLDKAAKCCQAWLSEPAERLMSQFNSA